MIINAPTNWNNCLLTGQLAKAILKQCIRCGYITFVNPQNEYEKKQINYLQADFNRTRCDQAALYYMLLFDKVVLNEDVLAFTGLESKKDGDDYRSALRFQSSSLDMLLAGRSCSAYHFWNKFPLKSKVKDPFEETLAQGVDAPMHEKARLFALLEPLIWNGIDKEWRKVVSRQVLRSILDQMVTNPEIQYQLETEFIAAADESSSKGKYIDDRKHVELDEWRAFFRGTVSSMDSDALIMHYRAIVRMIVRKGECISGLMREAIRSKAILPVYNLSFGRSRSLYRNLPSAKQEQIITSVRLFLNEIKYWPRLENLDDVLRLRENPMFTEFRTMLLTWVTAFISGDAKTESKLRKEIAAANHALKTSISCEHIGRFFVYMAIPLIILDLVIGPFFGTTLGITGFGIQAYADWLKTKNKWLLVGKDK